MKIIYGPVSSWRLGRSLGIDLICSTNKICSLNCTYCQLNEPYKLTKNRQNFISITELENELKNALKKTKADVVTLSGMGEPTLAKNIGEAITIIKNLTDLPVAILTNSTLLYKKNIQDSLSKLDIIIAKLDAINEETFKKINQPKKGITFKKTIDGIKQMRREFKGKFALQIMFINKNKNYAFKFAELSKEIKPNEIQINTPLRPCYELPLSKNELGKIEKLFHGLNTKSVYTSKKPVTNPLDKMELIKRRREDP
jgi:wyosine [tRNA(Phe)-imidazoG37] synthetase (radical SAM superfamily)